MKIRASGRRHLRFLATQVYLEKLLTFYIFSDFFFLRWFLNLFSPVLRVLAVPLSEDWEERGLYMLPVFTESKNTQCSVYVHSHSLER